MIKYKNERTVVPAQPGYFVVQRWGGEKEDDLGGLHLLPVLAWVTEISVYDDESPTTQLMGDVRVTTSYPVTLESVTVDDSYIIKCPDGRYFSPELQYWDTGEDEEVLKHLATEKK